MNQMKRIRRIGALSISIVLLLILLVTVPLPIKVDRTLNGIRWENGDGQWEEECQVAVNGWYYRYLLRDNIFKGDPWDTWLSQEIFRESLSTRMNGTFPPLQKTLMKQ